jgi:hypothetical protein
MNLEALSRAGKIGGSISSEKKIASSTKNAKIASQVRAERGKYVSLALCSCGAGNSMEHKSSCGLYKQLWFRKKHNKEIIFQ